MHEEDEDEEGEGYEDGDAESTGGAETKSGAVPRMAPSGCRARLTDRCLRAAWQMAMLPRRRWRTRRCSWTRVMWMRWMWSDGSRVHATGSKPAQM